MQLTRTLRRLLHDRSGIALTEFAFAFPLVLGVGMLGLEVARLAMVRMQISQVAMETADTMTRVGVDNGLSQVQITEADVNDTFIGGQVGAGGNDLYRNGRVIISSLQMNANGGQWIAWQRCRGLKNKQSSYGGEGTNATGDANSAFQGMGPPNALVKAPQGSAVMYVETFYTYQPLFAFLWSDQPNGKLLGTVFNTSLREIRYGNAYLVRDNRDLTRIYNPVDPLTGQTAPVSDCGTYTT